MKFAHGALRVAGSAVVIGTLLVTATPAYASTSTQLPVTSTGFFGDFLDVTVVSATDGWAVGGNGNGIVERFNGARWSLVASPDLLAGTTNSWATLAGVDSVPAGSAFAVGSATGTNQAGKSAVALRWNGSAWNRLAVPKPADSDTGFTAVKAFSASDVWAIGDTATTSVRKTLAMHYNGTSWTTTPTPIPGTRNNDLKAVDGVAANDVWAVGYSLNLPYGNRVRQSMILHWNGTAWSQLPSPNSESTYLYDVAAVSASDAWAVGYASTGGAYVVRWNGTAWNAVAAPPLGGGLRSVTARSGNDVWVAGSDADGAPALAHWNGTAWSVTPVTVTGGVGQPLLFAVTVADATTEWVVGSQWDGESGQSAPIAFRITG
jgi:hypothetical protein